MSLFEEEYHTVETFAMPYAPSSPVLFNDNSPEAPVLPTKEQRKVLSAYTPRSPVYKRYVSSNNTANVPEQVCCHSHNLNSNFRTRYLTRIVSLFLHLLNFSNSKMLPLLILFSKFLHALALNVG